MTLDGWRTVVAAAAIVAVGVPAAGAPGTSGIVLPSAERGNLELSNRLLRVAGGPGPTSETLLRVANLVLGARRPIPAQAVSEMLPAVGRQHSNISRARRWLAAVSATGTPPDLAALARAGAAEAMRALGVEHARIPSRIPTTPSAAVLDLVRERGEALAPAQVAEVLALDRLPPGLSGALGRLILTFREFDVATRGAFDQAGTGRLRHRLRGAARGPGADGEFEEVRRAMPGLAGVFAARDALLEASLSLERSFRQIPPSQLTRRGDPVVIPGLLSIDLTDEDDTYVDDFLLLVDGGGHDTYRNNAGGSGLAPDPCPVVRAPVAAALIDLGGDDEYRSGRLCGVNGGGYLGAGFLFDAAGDDVYAADGVGIDGGGDLGAGFLLDVSGSDQYVMGGLPGGGGAGANGGGSGGSGMLIDGAGDDRYSHGEVADAINGSGKIGVGLLLDVAGSDVFEGGTFGNGSGALGGVGQLVDLGGDDVYAAGGNGGGGGAGQGLLLDMIGNDSYVTEGGNGAGGSGGAGLLVDLSGDDAYQGQGGGLANGTGLQGGVGLLVDVEGNDSYTASGLASNGTGAQGGLGLLLDGAGDDVYLGGEAANGFGAIGGAGFLFDHSGNDSYQAQVGANGGGVVGGAGMLLDSGGDDEYVATSVATNGGQVCGVGFLRDTRGNDSYQAGSMGTNGGGACAGSGALIDDGGDDHYTAEALGVNGGASFPGGTGLLLDRGGHDVYFDLEGGSGSNCTILAKGVLGNQVDLPHLGCPSMY